MSRDLIPPDHPYIKLLRPSVYLTHTGEWAVLWRDFLTVKQDVVFQTEQAARHFARKVILGPHMVPDWAAPEDIAAADRFWRDMGSA